MSTRWRTLPPRVRLEIGVIGAVCGAGLALVVDAPWAYTLGFVVVSVCIAPLVVRLLKL